MLEKGTFTSGKIEALNDLHEKDPCTGLINDI